MGRGGEGSRNEMVDVEAKNREVQWCTYSVFTNSQRDQTCARLTFHKLRSFDLTSEKSGARTHQVRIFFQDCTLEKDRNKCGDVDRGAIVEKGMELKPGTGNGPRAASCDVQRPVRE